MRKPAGHDAELQAARARIAELEARLAAAEEIANLGGHTLDLRTGALTLSSGFRRIHGLTPDQPFSLDQLKELILPEDRARVAAIFDQAQENCTPYEVEFSWEIGRAHV